MPESLDSGPDNFLATRALAQRGAIDRQWEALIGGGEKSGDATAKPAGAAAATVSGQAVKPAGDQPVASGQDSGGGELPLMPDYWDQLSSGSRLVIAPSFAAQNMAQTGSAIAAVGKDVSKGVIDAPRQVIGGALDFVNNLWGFADKAVRQAEQAGIPNVYFRLFDEDGKFSPQVESPEAFRKAQAEGKEHIFEVPTTGDPDTVTGNLIRSAVPFLIGRGTGGGIGKVVGGGIPGEALRDFTAGAVASNPDQPRLSNIIDQVAPNFVSNFLKAKPEDEGSLLGNLKTGLEFAGLGMLINPVLRAVKSLKDSGASGDLADIGAPGTAGEAKPAAATETGAAAEPPVPAAETGPQRDILTLGDPLAPRVQIRSTPQDAAMAEVTAGRIGAANEPSAVGPAAGPREPPITEGALPHEPVPPEPERLASWLVGKGGLQDPGGDISYITGDTRARPALINSNGMTLDDAARAAWEEGFLPGAERPTPDALIDALADDLRGNAHYRGGDVDAAAKFTEATDRNRELDEIGSQYNIPTRHITRDDFWNAYADKVNQETPSQIPLLQPGNDAAFEAAHGRVVGRPPGLAEPSIMSEQTISDYLAGRRVDNPVKINLGRIGSNEDIADTLAQVSRTIPQQAVQSNEATAALSDALGMTPENFIAGYRGANLNASETTAMRFMLDSSAGQLLDYARAARDPLAGAEAKAQFVKAFTVHRALQEYAENARAEAGRTLQSWAIMSQQRSNYAKAIGDMIRTVDQSGDIGAMADRVAALDNPLQLSRFVAQSMQGQGRDMFLSVWYNALLSSPTTVVKKLASDVGMATWNAASTYVAELFGSGAVPAGESFELLAGYSGAFKDAIRAGGKAWAAGESQFYRDHQTLDWARAPGGSPAEMGDRIARNSRISAQMNGVPEVLPPTEPTKAWYEYLRPLAPTSWIAGADDFAKTWNYRAELRRLAWRASDGSADKFANLLDDPSHTINQQAIGAALKNTFQEPLTGIGAGIRDIANAVNIPIYGTDFKVPIGRMIMPFVKVPFNIAKTAYENSPLAYFFRTEAMDRILSGGPSAERDIALAKIGMGSAVTLGLADLALNGYITGRGPTDPSLNREWRAAGNQPYSLQIPGRAPVSMNQIEPFGLTFGAVADTFNILKFREDEADFQTLLPSLALGIGNAMLAKTYFSGVANFFDALMHPEHEADKWSSAMVAGFAPQLGSRLGDATDNWARAHYGAIDAIEAKLPFLRENLPPQRTVWGDPVPARDGYLPFMSRTGLAAVVSPLTLGHPAEDAQPVDKWIWENRDAFGLGRQGEPRGISKMSRTQSYGNPQQGMSVQIELDPQQYDRLQVLAGNGIKDPTTGMGLKDTLNALVMGIHPNISIQRQWNNASPEEQVLSLKSYVGKFQTAAREQMRVDYLDIEDALEGQWRARAAAIAAGRPH